MAGMLDAVGNTPLVELRRVRPTKGARVMVKLEFANPTGSMKDRIALAMVTRAVVDGRLRPGGRVVEYTGGSTGMALAFVCAALGYGCTLVSSDAFSEEKRAGMAAFGAEVLIVASDRKRITEELIKEMIATAERLATEPGTYWTDQLNNRDGEAGYHPMGEEIWKQTGGRVAAYVQSVGTAHSLHGAADALRQRRSDIQIVAVEPEESPVLSTGRTGGHRIGGIGIGFVPPLFRPEQVDKIFGVGSDDAMKMARRLAAEEGIFAGTSTGANVIAALQMAEGLSTEDVVVTLAVDSGVKYLSTELYALKQDAAT
ncbi:MAG TPA: cysteine synthase family protein [Candidatus Dormibacteraeota bacterium]|nr:cysteine synthase family protein [Candidatus Dormibacteraeota bacterium]